jgi:phosphoglycolate phosphatase-like HAD superfamily hydrolase
MGVPVEACLMVGDTPIDIHTGVAAGAQTIGVLCGFGNRYELEKAGANLILESTAELPAILDHN